MFAFTSVYVCYLGHIVYSFLKIDIHSFILFGKQTYTHTKQHNNKQDKQANAQNRNTIKIMFASSRGA